MEQLSQHFTKQKDSLRVKLLFLRHRSDASKRLLAASPEATHQITWSRCQTVSRATTVHKCIKYEWLNIYFFMQYAE